MIALRGSIKRALAQISWLIWKCDQNHRKSKCSIKSKKKSKMLSPLIKKSFWLIALVLVSVAADQTEAQAGKEWKVSSVRAFMPTSIVEDESTGGEDLNPSARAVKFRRQNFVCNQRCAIYAEERDIEAFLSERCCVFLPCPGLSKLAAKRYEQIKRKLCSGGSRNDLRRISPLRGSVLSETREALQSAPLRQNSLIEQERESISSPIESATSDIVPSLESSEDDIAPAIDASDANFAPSLGASVARSTRPSINTSPVVLTRSSSVKSTRSLPACNPRCAIHHDNDEKGLFVRSKCCTEVPCPGFFDVEDYAKFKLLTCANGKDSAFYDYFDY